MLVFFNHFHSIGLSLHYPIAAPNVLELSERESIPQLKYLTSITIISDKLPLIPKT